MYKTGFEGLFQSASVWVPDAFAWIFWTVLVFLGPRWPMASLWMRNRSPDFPAVTACVVAGSRITPEDPRSESVLFRSLQVFGVYQSARVRSEPENLRTDSPKLVEPSKSPLPVATKIFPFESMAGASPECQMDAP